MDPSLLLVRVTDILAFIAYVLFVTRHFAAFKTFLKTISEPVMHLLPLPRRNNLPALDENPSLSESPSSVIHYLTTIGNLIKSLPGNFSKRLGLQIFKRDAESDSFEKRTIALDSSVPSPALTTLLASLTGTPLADTLTPTTIVIHTLQPPQGPARVSLHVSVDCSMSGLAALVTLCATCIILFLLVRHHHPRAAVIQVPQASTTATQNAPETPRLTNASAVQKNDMVPEEERETSIQRPAMRTHSPSVSERTRNKDQRVPSWI